ncbi:aminotransferase class V-fold PLP-dependent enzyme [Inquilinus sp. CAU 1745]|uniref:aminotransferase class V-fold PLP-dependent enzyme n=1 Tax=Inquilinus sp. CAU 1745 TaxID=3140369 RepID=UPI00325B7143
MTSNWDAFYGPAGLRPVINVSGTMTSLGASIAVPEVTEAMAAILPRFVNMHELHGRAAKAIAESTGAESGFVTASASAGITIAIAAAMTGPDMARIEQLPDATGMKDAVIVQTGHLCHYGAPVEQAVRLAGARVVPIGTATLAVEHNLTGALEDDVAAALYVVSHHVVDYGQLPLKRFAELCHERGVPVIVDAASEYDLAGFLRDGADIVIYSAHKFLSGPTGGIVAGRRDLVRAAYMQNGGVGRGMKVGKETIAGVMAALSAWSRRDHEAVRAREDEAARAWLQAAEGFEGVDARLEPDPTDNPLDRLVVRVDPRRAGASALAIAADLAAGEPAIIIRDHESDRGIIQFDPCNLHEGQAEIVARRLRETLKRAAAGKLAEPDPDAWRRRSAAGYLAWEG